MNKHTPGPWSLLENPEYPSLIGIEMSDRKEVGYLAAKSEPNEVANARLIAASPTMKEALEEVSLLVSYALEENPDCDWVDILKMIGKKSRDAIAKAEGK